MEGSALNLRTTSNLAVGATRASVFRHTLQQ